MYVVIEISDAEALWAPHLRCLQARVIPADRRPTVLHPTGEIAEREAMRLEGLHPHGRFLVFGCCSQAVRVEIRTHVNIHG